MARLKSDRAWSMLEGWEWVGAMAYLKSDRAWSMLEASIRFPNSGVSKMMGSASRKCHITRDGVSDTGSRYRYSMQ